MNNIRQIVENIIDDSKVEGLIFIYDEYCIRLIHTITLDSYEYKRQKALSKFDYFKDSDNKWKKLKKDVEDFVKETKIINERLNDD